MPIKESVQHHSQGIMEAVKVTPPLGVLGSKALGANLQEWILLGTLLYTVLLIIHKIFQIWKDVRKYNRNDPESKLDTE